MDLMNGVFDVALELLIRQDMAGDRLSLSGGTLCRFSETDQPETNTFR